MKSLRLLIALACTVAAGDSAGHAQTLFRKWELTMSDVQALSRVAAVRGDRLHDAQGSVRVGGILSTRQKSGPSPKQLFFDMDFTTTLLRGTEYDPDFLRVAIAAGYRHRREDRVIDFYAEHLRRMNTDRLGRRDANFFGVGVADPEFDLRRFGSRRRLHGRVAGGGLVNESGFKGDVRYLAMVRYDYSEFSGRFGDLALAKGQIFFEGQIDAIDAPGGLMADVEGGIRFLFFPGADNSLSISAKYYDSKNPFGHGDDGIRIDLDLEGKHAGEVFNYFLGNTSGEIVTGFRGEDVATELQADFDLVRAPCRGRSYLIVLDSLQRTTWGNLNMVEYNIQGGIETVIDPSLPRLSRHLKGFISGLYLDHRSTHGLDRNLGERNYNIVRLGVKTPGWDAGREKETARGIAAHFSIGNYIENSFKKSRNWDARAGIRLDGKSRAFKTWEIIPYAKGTLRNATNHGRREELTGELGFRFNGHSIFARWNQDAFYHEGGLAGVAMRF